MNQATRNKLKPALIGGSAEGFASSIPLLGLANVACGLLVVGGGVLAAYLYMKDAPPSARAPSATAPIEPTAPPPYTTVWPARAMVRPRASAAS